MLYIHQATILTPEQCMTEAALLIEKDRIMEVGKLPCSSEAQAIDATGCYLVPGFIDLQLNGGFGHDFTTNPESIWAVARKLPRYGVTSFLPTIITAPLQTIVRAQRVLNEKTIVQPIGAVPLGLHLEGPFLHPSQKGAHSSTHLRQPAIEAIAHWSPEQGIRLVTLAPELPQAERIIRTLSERGVIVGAGHSTATYEELLAGVEAGLKYGTHLFNAMTPLHHREPGLVGALLTHKDMVVTIIPDGIHLHPAVVDLIWQLKKEGFLIGVSDAIAALGMGPGHYRLGEQTVIVSKTEARLANGTLAGSILSLDVALRNLMEFTSGSLSEILPALTTTPARLLDLTHRGYIAPGYIADLVLLNNDLEPILTIVEGEIVYSQNSTMYGRKK